MWFCFSSHDRRCKKWLFCFQTVKKTKRRQTHIMCELSGVVSSTRHVSVACWHHHRAADRTTDRWRDHMMLMQTVFQHHCCLEMKKGAKHTCRWKHDAFKRSESCRKCHLCADSTVFVFSHVFVDVAVKFKIFIDSDSKYLRHKTSWRTVGFHVRWWAQGSNSWIKHETDLNQVSPEPLTFSVSSKHPQGRWEKLLLLKKDV